MKSFLQSVGIETGLLANLWVPGITSFVINILGLIVPLVLVQVYNRVLPNQATATLSLMVIGVLVALLMESVFRVVRAYYMGWTGARFEHRVSCGIFRRLLHANPAELEGTDGSQFMERMNAVNQVGELYSGQAMMALFDVPFLLMYLLLIYLLAGSVVLVPLGALVLIGFSSAYVGNSLKLTLKQDTEQKQRRFGFITETLSRIHSVKALAMEALMLRRHEMLLIKGLRYTHDMIFLGAIMPALSSFTSNGMTAIVIALGAMKVMDGELTTGGLAACTMLAGRSLQPVQVLVAGWTRLQAIRMAHQEVDSLLSIPQRMNPESATAGERLSGGIELRNLSVVVVGKKGWRKPGQEPEPERKTVILKDISLFVDPGECIGIVGDSGSGKTTLMKVISGMRKATEGSVLVDGREPHEISRRLLAQIGYVSQKGTLFGGTILQNLTMFDESRNDLAMAVAARLGLDSVVARMPKGYHTSVGDGAMDVLPAGVLQRIAIARVLTMQPRVLLFDEANMAVDVIGDNMLRACLEDLKGQCTIILISQRPSLLRMADRVFWLRDGDLHPLDDIMDFFRALPKKKEDSSQDAAVTLEKTGEPVEGRVLTVFERREGLTQEQQWHYFVDHMHHPTAFSRCLKELLAAVRWRGTARQLAEAIPHLTENIDLTDFCVIMANLNFTYREAVGNLEAIDERLMPFLFVANGGQVVVALSKGSDGQVEVFDGASGEIKKSHGFGKGHAFLFSVPIEDTTSDKGWVRSQLDRFRPVIWTIMLISLIGNVMGSMSPVFIMMIYGSIIPSGAKSMAGVLLIGLLLALMMDLVVRVQRVKLMAYIGARAERALNGGIMDRILALPASYTERVAVGVQVARVRSLEVIREMLTGPLSYLFYDALSSVFYIIVLGIINPEVILFMLFLIMGLFIVGAILFPIMRNRSSLSSRFGAQRQAFLTEALDLLQTIQSNHAQDSWYERYRDVSGKATFAAFRINMMTSLLGTISQTLTMAASVGVMSMTAEGVMEGKLTSGAVMAAMLLTWRIFAPVQTTFLGLAKMIQVNSSMTQTDRLMELKAERNASSIAQMGRRFKGEVVFNRVSFRYRNDADPALVGVSFRAPPGAVVVVIGSNGSGKSTLLKMILGLYTPQAGSVFIDNGDIRQTDPLELRQGVGYLPQNCEIFFGSVAQNLRLVNPDASDEELAMAAAHAGLAEDIRRMPEGMNTRLHEGGGGVLSSGFRQRLSLARVYLKNLSIMLYDEPTNNLDAASEQMFLDVVKHLRGSSTIFIVTHRPSHLKIADYVVYMEGGYLRAFGPPEDVKKVIPASFV